MATQGRLRDILSEGSESLCGISSTPDLDSEILLAHVLEVDRLRLVVERDRVLTAEEIRRFRHLVTCRQRHEPVAYLVGKREFWGIEIPVNPHVLIPRPETEILVECALEWCKRSRGGGVVRVLDLGVGSGAISLALASDLQARRSNLRVYGVDKSVRAVEHAARAARALRVPVSFLVGSWLDAMREGELFHLIVSNPPYVGEGEEVSSEVHFEPRDAVFAGDDGFAAIDELLTEVPKRLYRGGRFLCEIGSGQEAEVRRRIGLSSELLLVEVVKDLSGLPRVVVVDRR